MWQILAVMRKHSRSCLQELNDFSALFTGDELEKMANDESYKQERLDMINDALEKSSSLKNSLPTKRQKMVRTAHLMTIL